MGTTLKVKLSTSSINNAIKEVEKYRGSLETRTRVFVGRLAEIGLEVARNQIYSSPLGKCVSIDVNYQNPKMGCKAMLLATGQTLYSEMGEGSVNALLLIEFGAGIVANPLQNPLAEEFGMGAGTYGKGHGADPNGWYYLNLDGKWVHTYGTRATMPMYSADIEIIQNIQRIAKEVFQTNRVVKC